jgi:hypothetical protein
MILLDTPNGPQLILPGDDWVAPDGRYLKLPDDHPLPPGPRSEWIIDWETGEITTTWEPPAALPEPDWDALNAAILLEPNWQAATAIVRGINPGITEALPAAMTQISTGQTAMFAFLYSQICTLAEVSPAQRETWATMAEGFNLPAEFVVIVRGS